VVNVKSNKKHNQAGSFFCINRTNVALTLVLVQAASPLQEFDPLFIMPEPMQPGIPEMIASGGKTGPIERYNKLVKHASSDFDQAQQFALQALDELYLQLTGPKHQAAIQGLYLWGKVGRGKTFLMDLLVDSLPGRICQRLHFHHFMRDIHRQLNTHQGHAEPLKIIAKNLRAKCRVLCFDEFLISDIGDAMLLGRLMQYLFEFDVILVATSNTEPTQLYWNGLQRASFMPAIEAIVAHTCSIHLDGPADHRERPLNYAQNYFVSPRGQPNGLESTLAELGLALQQPDELSVLGRRIPCLAINDKALCCTFSQLCEGPRSHFDYIEIARRFASVVILEMPPLGGLQHEQIRARGTEDGIEGSGTTGERAVMLAPMDDAARRFIALVDEFYACRVKLFISSTLPLVQLYTQGSLAFEFERARSRLTEMSSVDYQQLAHRPSQPE
jgi:cell division protein ZapE